MSNSQSQQPSISIVVPTFRADENLERCLESVTRAVPPADELVVVVDGGDPDACALAARFGARVATTDWLGGPSGARNEGSRLARGDILFFVDSDVLVPADAVANVLNAFASDPELAAVFGSYDDAPDAPNFLSQYKNLLHHYVHQSAHEQASTFWAGCGAVRRSFFVAHGGFDEGYHIPSMEDIELGYRLRASGLRIRLLKSLQAKHLKHWTADSLLRADFLARALPWSELILRSGVMINDLNVNKLSRTCVVLVYAMLLSLALAWRWFPFGWFALGCTVVLLLLNAPLYRFFRRKRGLLFALATIPWHWFYYLYSGLAFAIAWVRYQARARGQFGSGSRPTGSRPSLREEGSSSGD